jgi:outer membrane protein insertion porin family
MNVQLEEHSTGELSIGAGFSSTDNFIADFSITERNLLGRGQFLRLRLTFSGRRQQIDLRFTEPYFLDRQLAAGFDIFQVKTDFEDESGFKNQSRGISLRTGFPLTEYSSLGVRYTFRQDDIEVSEFLCEAGYISVRVCDQRGKQTTSVVGYTWSLDKRNDPIEPTRGWQVQFSQDFAGAGGSVRYIRSEFGGGYYYGLFEGVVARLTATGGYVQGWGGRDVRLNDRFYKGGSRFRGFEVSGIGPRDLKTDDALGGKMYGIASIELTFPLGLPEEFGIKAALFTDVGTLGKLDSSDLGPNIVDDLAIRGSAGVSVFWDSPFGPVRLDFGHAFLKESYDKTEGFRFSAGTRF